MGPAAEEGEITALPVFLAHRFDLLTLTVPLRFS
jgi:hypothetical protein